MADRIFIRGIPVFARHGAYVEEAKLGQRFEIDVDCFLDLSSFAEADDVRRAVNYAQIYESVRKVAEEERFNLIEALAERIAGRLLAEFPVDAVRIEVRKPGAPVPGVFDTVGVEITRSRGGR